MPREMKESEVDWIGVIPKDWELLRNKNVFTCSKELVGDQSATTQLLSLTTHGIKEKSIEDVSGKQPESFDSYQIVEPNDIVMCLFDLDCSAVFSGVSNYYGMVSPAYKVVSCKEHYNPEYYDLWFDYVFNGRKFTQYAKNLRYTLNYDEFAALPVLAPSEDEQKRIATYLKEKCNEIDKVITDTERSIEEYKKLKQSIITEAVTKGVRGHDREMKDSGIEWIGQIPKEWKIMRVKCCIKAIVSGAWGNDAKKDSNDIVCMRIADFDYDRLSFKKDEKYTIRNYDKNIIERLRLFSGDVLIEKSGGGDKTPVGRAVVFDLGINALYANFMDKIICKDGYDSRWLTYVFAAFYQNGFTKSYIKQTTGIQNLDLTAMISSERIPIPEKGEQDEIVLELDKQCNMINDLIDKKNSFIDELNNYKKSIIYEYVTGKKEVPKQ